MQSLLLSPYRRRDIRRLLRRYDETTYLNALRKRGSPLLKNLDLG
ncbi:hypothetical protein J2W17_001039 [Pseudomonas lini]|jgi:hypothetical protein|nr:hypothetical protein [Pseudomonas lini]